MASMSNTADNDATTLQDSTELREQLHAFRVRFEEFRGRL